MWLWPFSSRGSRGNGKSLDVLPLSLPGDLSVFGRNDACIKLWLPEKLTDALDSLSNTHGMSRPDGLRWLLFEHVYGRAAFERLREWKRQQDELERQRREELRRQEEVRRQNEQLQRDRPEVRYSPARANFDAPRTVTATLLGKSQEDFKLWLPVPLKAELDKLARMEGLPLSDYMRKTLVRILLGEAFHHRWQVAIGKLPAEVAKFESGN
jgi:hypothetical protein